MLPRPRRINFLTNAAASAARLFIPLHAVQDGTRLEDVGSVVAGGAYLFALRHPGAPRPRRRAPASGHA